MNPFQHRPAWGAAPPGPHEPVSSQLSPTLTAVFGVFSLLPMTAVVGVAIYLTTLPMLNPGQPPPLAMLLGPLAAIFAIAFLQIVLGVIATVLASARTDLTGSDKALWSLGSIFVGSLVLPLFWFAVLRKPMQRHPGPHY